MTELNQIYKCEVCGNVVSVVGDGAGTLVCCGQDMKLIEEKTATKEGKEKHVPVIKVEGKKVIVNVGSVDHPMEEKHFIQFIEVLKDGKIIGKKELSPGEKPRAEFCFDDTSRLTAREYCNIHGLWKS